MARALALPPTPHHQGRQEQECGNSRRGRDCGRASLPLFSAVFLIKLRLWAWRDVLPEELGSVPSQPHSSSLLSPSSDSDRRAHQTEGAALTVLGSRTLAVMEMPSGAAGWLSGLGLFLPSLTTRIHPQTHRVKGEN